MQYQFRKPVKDEKKPQWEKCTGLQKKMQIMGTYY